jgi:hypothetical protein
MIAAAVGVGGAAAAGMAGITGMTATGPGHSGGVLGALVRIGPWLIVAAALLVGAAFALTRRPVTAIPALAAGAVLYAGMYAQNNLPVMLCQHRRRLPDLGSPGPLWASRPRHNPTAPGTPSLPATAPEPAAHDCTTTE